MNYLSDEYQSGDNNDSSYLPDKPIEFSTPVRNVNLRPRKGAQHALIDDQDISYFCPILDLNDPQTLEEVISSPHADQWKKAMQAEYDSFRNNKIWSLVDLPPGKRALPCKWIFKRPMSTGNLFVLKQGW